MGFESINERDARAMLYKLAGPDFNGRSPEQPGHGLAVAWMVDQLRRAGVGPGSPDGTYLQLVTVQFAEVVEARFEAEDGTLSLTEGADFAFSASQAFDIRGARVAFLRVPKGAAMPVVSDDALDGTLVIVHPDTATHEAAVLRALQSRALGRRTAFAAFAPEGTPIKSSKRTVTKEAPPQSELKMPSVSLSPAAAGRLARALGATGYLDSDPSGATFERPTQAFRLAGKLLRTDRFVTHNVLGMVKGDDPVLSHQAVVVGSHLDHEGVKPKGTYWGADDDASGCTANFLAARAIALNPVRPRRTVLFAFWSVEEFGLLGSWTYATNPTIPMADTVAYLNMDMVGRDSMDARWNDQAADNVDAIYAASAKMTSRDLFDLVHRANRFVNLRLRDDRQDTTFRSDTGSFARHKVPVLKAFTGEHPDYHRPTDTPDKINYPKLTQVARWIYLCAQVLANQEGRPRFDEGVKQLMGKLTYREKVALSPEAVVRVQLWDSTDPSVPVLLDETTVTRPGQVPVRFALHYREWSADKRYEITARIMDGGKLLFATRTPVRALESEPGTRVDEFLVEAVP